MNEELNALKQAAKYLEDGFYLEAYESVRPIIEDPEQIVSESLHLGCLALARSGATNFARTMLEQYRKVVPEIPKFITLEGRIYKDLARSKARFGDLNASKVFYTIARNAYLKVYQGDKSPYTGINCATLSLLIGEIERAKDFALEVITLCDKNPGDDYWHYATLIEANLILARKDQVVSYIDKAIHCEGFNVSARVTTYQQLSAICEILDIDVDIVAELHPPLSLHFSGPLIHGVGKTQGLFTRDVESIRIQVRKFLGAHDVSFAYGSLACGGDLIIASELINSGIKVHAILPFSKEEFVKSSVAPGGEEWVSIFEEVYKNCNRIDVISEDTIENQELLYKLASNICMGLANLKARELNSKAIQLLIWNNNRAKNGCGSHYDSLVWDSLPKTQLRYVIEYTPEIEEISNNALCVKNADNEAENKEISKIKIERLLRAMIFADVKGFSKLREDQLPIFMERWTTKLKNMKDEFSDSICLLNTWGDAVFAVFSEIVDAAQFACRLSKIFDDQEDPKMGIRVSAHAGPVYQVYDPIIDNFNFYGRPVNQTARMEPCTPLGVVYVTEEFSSYLALKSDKYSCTYAGEHVLPKNFGTLRMYCLNG